MRFVLLMNVPRGGAYQIGSWPEADIKAHIGFLRGFNQKLRRASELVSVEALAGPDHAMVVRAAEDGMPVTDGIFPETKEFLAGFWMVDVDTPERAYAIAAEASAAPGIGGVPLNMPIEVRRVMGVAAPELPDQRPTS